MRRLLYIFLLLFPALAFGQVVKTAAVPYTKGAGYTPNIAGSSEIRIDTATSALYWWSRDALTWMRFRPGVDVITGSVPPAYTPRDNMSLFAVNADSELFYYDGSTWNQIGGSGAGGIYGGSGTVPDNTTATLTDELTFSGGDLTNFSVETGSAMGGALASSFTAFATSYRDTLGDTKLELNDTGAEFSFGDGPTDRLTIDGRDARYAGDYSATFSDRSLIDKAYADAAVTAAVSIPSPEIAIGDDTGLTSSANFTYETGQMTLGGTLPIASIEDGGASSSTSGGLLRLANFDGAAMSSGHRLGALDFMAVTDGSGGTAVGATVEVVARSNWSGTSSPTYISFKTANVGGTTPHEKFRITSTALGTTYRAELRDRTTLDLFNTGNTVNGRIEVTDTALYIIPPEGGINVGEVGINGKLGLSAGSVTITADENDLYMGTASDAVLIEIAATGATRTLTGINPANSTNTSRLICLYNSGTEDIILSNQDVLSLQANRFNIISDFTLEPDNAVWLFHLSATEGWIMPGGGGGGTGVTDHGALTGLGDDDHTQYALLLGRSGSQTLIGGTAANDDLTLNSTSNATKGDVFIQSGGGNVTVGGGATASEIKFLEPSGSGSNYTSFKAGAQTGDVTYTLPPAAPTASGQVLASTTGGVQSWVDLGSNGAVSTLRVSIAATTNDYSPTGYSTTREQFIEVTSDSLFRTITGLTAATRDGVEKTFSNPTRFCYILAKQHTGSSAANRFDIAKDVVVFPNMEATVRYDSIGQRWKLAGTNKSNVTFNAIIEEEYKIINASTANGLFQHNSSGGTSTPSGADNTNFLRIGTLVTGAVATSFPSISVGTNPLFIAANCTYFRMACRVKVSALSTAAEDYDLKFGFKNAVDTNSLTEGALVSYEYQENSGGFTLKTHDGSTPNSVNAGGPVVATTYYNLELIYYPYGEVTCFINNVRYTTTSNLPTLLAINPYLMMDKDNGGTSRTASFTNFEYFGCYVLQ